METNGTMRSLGEHAPDAVGEPAALLRQPHLVLAWDDLADGWVLLVNEPHFDLPSVRARGLVRA